MGVSLPDWSDSSSDTCYASDGGVLESARLGRPLSTVPPGKVDVQVGDTGKV